MLDPELLKIYRETDYTVQTMGGIQVLKINQQSDFLDMAHTMHLADCSAYITACNPDSQRVSDERNLKATRALLSDIKERWARAEGVGRHPAKKWPEEASYLIFGITYSEAAGLAHKYGQKAFLYSYKENIPRLVWRSSAAEKFPYGYNSPYDAEVLKKGTIKVNFLPRGTPTLETILNFLKEHNYAYPHEAVWYGMCEIFLQERHDEPPPRSIVLAGWHIATHDQKRQRFIDHLEWAKRHDLLEEVYEYICLIDKNSWIYDSAI